MSRVRGVTAATIASGSGATTTTSAPETASAPSRPKCSSVVVTISSPGRRPRPRTAIPQPSVVELVSATCAGSAPTSVREGTAELLAQAHRRLEVRQAAAALDEVALDPGRESLGHRSRERAERARVEERDRLEHREERAGLGEGHDATSETTRSSTGAWSESTAPFCRRLARGHVSRRVADVATDEDVVDPLARRAVAVEPGVAHVEVAGEHDRLARARVSLGELAGPTDLGARDLGVREVVAGVEVGEDDRAQADRRDEPHLAAGEADPRAPEILDGVLGVARGSRSPAPREPSGRTPRASA